MDRITGLEVLFSTIKSDVKSKEDCAIAALHCLLLNSDLLCVGVGEEFSDDDAVSELLPENWNLNQDMYSLRYRSKDFKKCYLLKVVKTGSNLHVEFGTLESKPVSTTINANEFVADEFHSFSQAFKKLDVLKNQVKEDILKVVEVKQKSSSSHKKESSKKKASPNKEPIQDAPKVDNPQHRPQIDPVGRSDLLRTGREPHAYPQIGASDLDPLGRSQGGMLFDPFSRSSRSGLGPFSGGQGGRFGIGGTDLPPGAVPPGARFDPFSPITPGRFNPDPDHFRSDYNNMFM